jgi:hypothetical protein
VNVEIANVVPPMFTAWRFACQPTHPFVNIATVYISTATRRGLGYIANVVLPRFTKGRYVYEGGETLLNL